MKYRVRDVVSWEEKEAITDAAMDAVLEHDMMQHTLTVINILLSILEDMKVPEPLAIVALDFVTAVVCTYAKEQGMAVPATKNIKH